jgi:hypothetical protein
MTSGSDILVEECVERGAEFRQPIVIRLAAGQGEATGHVAS